MMNSNATVSGVNTGLITYPQGRYEKYESRMRKLSEVLAFIRAHKIAISIGTAALTAAVLVFMFFVGVFIGGITCEDFVYGEPPAVSVNAFLADVTYQYASPGGEIWSETPPIVPGEYRIRAVSENPFGMKRYTEGAAFVLKPRPLTLAVNDAPCQYGDLTDEFLCRSMHIEGLAKGDTVVDVTLDRFSDRWDFVTVSIASYRVINADGTDVTDAYNITETGAGITVIEREITVTVVSGEKEYDGLPEKNMSYEITEGSLAEGDSINIKLSETLADAGSYTVIPEAHSIIDGTGEDITYKYNIAFKYGTFTVHPRPLNFVTGGGEKLYDGTPIVNSEWEHTGGSLLQGHILQAETVGSRQTVGQSPNTLRVTVTEENGRDVTNNYRMLVEEGVLEILPIVLNFSTESAEKVYDGIPLTAGGYEHTGGELLLGHRMVCYTTGKQTDVGKSNNTLSVTILDEDGAIVTEVGYKIVTDHGILSVTPRQITFESDSREKDYDGTPLVYYSMHIKEGSLAIGDIVSSIDYTGSQTEVGESPNTFKVEQISGSNGASKYQNYEISYVYGTLRVLPSDFTGNTVSGSGNTVSGSGNTVSGSGDITSGSGNTSSGGGGNGSPNYIPGGGTDISFPPTDASVEILASVKLIQSPSSTFRTYLRANSYGNYTGSGFAEAKIYNSSFEDYVSSLDFIGRNAQEAAKKQSVINIERLEGCPVIIPYYSLDTQQYFGRSDVYFKSDIMNYNYTFYEIPDLASVMELQGFYVNDKYESPYNDYVYTEYLQIPSTTRDALLRLAEGNGVGKYNDPYILITEIQNYIRNAATYNPYAKPYPAGVDVAVYFLEEAKEGICQHFAASATMMFRAFGIPARYTVGFVKNISSNTRYDITTMDAHA